MSGTIEIDELRSAVKNSDIDLKEGDIDEIVRQCDYNEDGLINYHEFIAATFPIEKHLTKERMEALFHRFDIDDQEKISRTNFRDAFTKLGINLSQQEIDEILSEHDVDGDQIITFKEFEAMLKGALNHK